MPSSTASLPSGAASILTCPLSTITASRSRAASSRYGTGSAATASRSGSFSRRRNSPGCGVRTHLPPSFTRRSAVSLPSSVSPSASSTPGRPDSRQRGSHSSLSRPSPQPARPGAHRYRENSNSPAAGSHGRTMTEVSREASGRYESRSANSVTRPARLRSAAVEHSSGRAGGTGSSGEHRERAATVL